jgi:hypothetical protein
MPLKVTMASPPWAMRLDPRFDPKTVPTSQNIRFSSTFGLNWPAVRDPPRAGANVLDLLLVCKQSMQLVCIRSLCCVRIVCTLFEDSPYTLLSECLQLYGQCVHASTTSRCGWTTSSSSPRSHSSREPAHNSPIPPWMIAGMGAWCSCAVSG